MDTYTALYQHVMFPLWEGLRGRDTPTLLRYLCRSQWCSPDELHAVQVGRLRRLLGHAFAEVPAYRRRLEEAGLDPGRLRSVADLAGLRPLDRTEAQAAAKDLIARGAGAALLTKSTSGTTGNPFRFSYNRESEFWRQAVKLRAYGWAGWHPGKRTLHYWGPPAQDIKGVKAAKTFLDRALRREFYFDCARQSEADLRDAARRLRELRPGVLVGFTQATVEWGRFIIKEGLRAWPAMRVLCGAERLFPKDRPVLEAAFGEPGSVFETYGCREFMLIASECEAHEGMHVSMENLVVEVVDENGGPVPAGTVGQVAITDLHNYAMPLIRYLTGDLAVAADSGARCPCGRGLGRLTSVEGRQADLLRGSDGRGIPGIVFNSVFAALGEKVNQFQVVQRRDGRIDLKVVPGPNFDDTVVDGVKARLRPYLGSLPLSVDLVPAIPALPSGKRRHVVVEA